MEKRYIKTGCKPGEYYVWFERKGNKQCVSEGQGYGMIITALMAGADPSAKNTFDGLFNFYKAHPGNHKYLMAWAQDKNCQDIDKSSATDGDMDIAYSLLLADTAMGKQGHDQLFTRSPKYDRRDHEVRDQSKNLFGYSKRCD